MSKRKLSEAGVALLRWLREGAYIKYYPRTPATPKRWSTVVLQGLGRWPPRVREQTFHAVRRKGFIHKARHGFVVTPAGLAALAEWEKGGGS